MANMTKAELQEELALAQGVINTLHEKHAEFRNNLLMVATQAAYDHDLCHVLDKTLEKIGIEVPDVEVIVESATVYRLPLTVASRIGLLDEKNDLKQTVKEVMAWGVLNDDYDDEDYGIPGGVSKDDPIIREVTIKQPLDQAV